MGKREEIIKKISDLVREKYGGDWKAAFEGEDADKDGKISSKELTAVFAAAGIGSGLTRFLYVNGTMEQLDPNRDGFIEWEDFAELG